MQTSLAIKEPGLNVLPPGVERYIVNAGGITGIQIFPDDEIQIINNEGNQICEINSFDKNGNSELGLLNLKENKNSSEIKKILFKREESSMQALLQLNKRNLKIEKAKSAILFDKKSKAGEKINLKSKDECYCIFAAPAGDMLVHDQNPPSDLTVIIVNIDRKTATGYQVKAGDYIQIITPTGRQCSDFVAYDTAKLEKGLERGLDWQTTRTFMGHTFPGPGLYSKFYDTDHEPLIEVIRDTVGIHPLTSHMQDQVIM